MNYEACHVAAAHFAKTLMTTDHLKSCVGIEGVKNAWVNCEKCKDSIKFGRATDILRNKRIQNYLDIINNEYERSTGRWFVPQRHFLCYSMNIPNKAKLTYDEIEERRNKLIAEKGIETERSSVLENLGVKARIESIKPCLSGGTLRLIESCHLQQRREDNNKIAHFSVDSEDNFIDFCVDAIPCALQGTTENGRRTFVGGKGDLVVCSVFLHTTKDQKTRLETSFLLPIDHYIINVWAEKASQSFMSVPFLRPMYCVPEDAKDDILDTISEANDCFFHKRVEKMKKRYII